MKFRRLLKLAALASLAGWLIKRFRKQAEPEGTWRDAGSSKWGSTGKE